MQYPYRYHPGIELIGQVGQAIIEHLMKDEIRESVERHGLGNMQPDQYYPVDNFINVFKDWYEKGTNLTQNLISVGLAVIDMVELPPDAAHWPLAQQLALVQVVYETSFRGGMPGELVAHPTDDNTLIYRHTGPWPDDLIYGVIYGFARHFLSSNYLFTLEYDPDTLRQDDGGDTTRFVLAWRTRQDG